MQEILDDVVAYELPRLDQGSTRHTVAVLQTLAAGRGIAVTREHVLATMCRLGFVKMKVPGYKRPRWVLAS
jgi:hypothetical protein